MQNLGVRRKVANGAPSLFGAYKSKPCSCFVVSGLGAVDGGLGCFCYDYVPAADAFRAFA